MDWLKQHLRWLLMWGGILDPDYEYEERFGDPGIEIDISGWLPEEVNDRMQQLPGESDEDHFRRAMAVLQEHLRRGEDG